jgi:enterobactin synthetase component F
MTSRVTSLHGLIEEVARREPDRVAMREGDASLTFGGLRDRTGELSAALWERGLKPGDVVALALPRSRDLVVACLAVMRAGGVVLPLDLHAPEARNRKLVDAARAPWSIVSRARVPHCVAGTASVDARAAGTPGNPDPEVHAADPAFLVFTSGTSGEPKGVLLSHQAMTGRSAAEQATYRFTPRDIYLLRTSPALIGLPVALEILALGVPFVIAPDEAGDDATLLASLIAEEKITFAGFPPRLIESLLALPDATEKLVSLRVIRSSGEALPVELGRRFKAALPSCRLVDGYGATEAGGVITTIDIEGAAAPGGGIPLPGIALRLADENGRPAEEGEIQLASPMLSIGYLGGEHEGEHRFVIEDEPGGGSRRWYRTGDRGRLERDGRLRILGRLDFQLNVDGLRVDPVEIENALRFHPSVKDAAVSTQPDASGRSRLIAFIVNQGPRAPSSALRTFLAGVLPPGMIPARLVHLEALPLTSSGKVDRARLPRVEAEEAPQREARDPAESMLLALFRDVLEAPEVGIDADFFEWGGDSLKAFALMSRIADRMGVRLPAAAILQAPTVEALAREVARGDRGEVSTTWLRKPGDLPPLACLPGLAGDPLWFLPLREALDSRQPMLGLSLVGLKPPISISTAASRGVAALRGVQPHGPYFLLGHSVGGVLAFEMARELSGLGEAVAFLGLIDTYVPGSGRLRSPEGVARVAKGLKRLRNRMLGGARRSLEESLTRFGVEIERSGPVFIPGLKEAALLHRLSPGDFAVTLFRANERTRGTDLAADWASLARGGVEVIDISGHHFEVLTGGRVRDLSARVAEAVGRALTSWSRGSSSRSG